MITHKGTQTIQTHTSKPEWYDCDFFPITKEQQYSSKVDRKSGLRFAERCDCALILRFIRDLAEYEHLSDAVVATEEALAEWLFDKQAAEVLFAVVDGREVGFALFFSNFSTFLGRAGMYLEDLYVLPDFRGQGIGTSMLRALAGLADERGYGRFEWACLDWNIKSIKLYRTLGAEPMSGWTTYRLSGDDIAKFAYGRQYT